MNLNYMNEIRRLENVIAAIGENCAVEEIGLRSKLIAMLENLKNTASYMADYINGTINSDVINRIEQDMINYYKEEDLNGYLNKLSDLMRIERIALICKKQTPDEKAYFIKEYCNYLDKNDKDAKGFSIN